MAPARLDRPAGRPRGGAGACKGSGGLGAPRAGHTVPGRRMGPEMRSWRPSGSAVGRSTATFATQCTEPTRIGGDAADRGAGDRVLVGVGLVSFKGFCNPHPNSR